MENTLKRIFISLRGICLAYWEKKQSTDAHAAHKYAQSLYFTAVHNYRLQLNYSHEDINM